MPDGTHSTFCRICEALCGLQVTVEDNRVVEIHPDAEHVATRGFSCPKGLKQHRLYGSPDRVKWPMKRLGQRWERVTWAQALEEIGNKVKQLRRDLGPDSIAMYVGTAAGFGVLHPVFAQGFMTGVGSRSMYASATQDCSNKFAVANLIYGFPFTQPFPDLDHMRCLIIVGANPVISKWSFLQVPNPARTLQELKARGGRVIVIDPRRTETARVAGEHHFIRPDTDPFFYLAFLSELERQGGVDRERASKQAEGLDEVLALARPWTPERCELVTSLPAATLRELVRVFRTSKGAALYSSTGVNMGSNGSLSFWLQECINLLSGNLDRRGGTLVGRGVIDFPAFGKKNGVLTRTDRSRIGDFGSVNDAFPGGLLADEILTPGARQVRALFVTGGNPLITMANAGRLKKAFESLELLVTLDLFRNETGSLAHYVLPATSPFERPDLPFIFPLMLGLQRNPYLQATRALVEPTDEQRDEASIYLELCRASGVNLFGSAAAQRLFESMMAVHSRLHRSGRLRALPQEALLSLLLRLTGQPAFDALADDHPHGKLRDAHASDDFAETRVLTATRKIQLAPQPLLDAARKLEGVFEAEKALAGELKLITKRAVQTHNSWTHNAEEFVHEKTNHLYLHPSDAEARGITDGALVDVSTDTATVRLPAKLLGDLMPGTVALPHGWGHQHATGLSIASKTRGVNVNLLAADGPDRLERVSGMAHLTGFVVEVKPAAGPQDPSSWSGLPPT
ncbi:MAG: molybdopterin-dependent oxidoreductase [Myxococcaceae bacterium]|nr:molybdopterin-dependent oxidoreductase [Myxococcaceae bacterium]